MKVRGFDGREYPFNTIGRQVYSNDTRQRSSLHLAARKILKDIFPLCLVYEEVPLPGTSSLRADFWIPEKRLIVEVHGEQHYKFIKHFHVNKAGYLDHIKRDNQKQEWCEMNNITHVVLPYNEDEDGWRRIISER